MMVLHRNPPSAGSLTTIIRRTSFPRVRSGFTQLDRLRIQLRQHEHHELAGVGLDHDRTPLHGAGVIAGLAGASRSSGATSITGWRPRRASRTISRTWCRMNKPPMPHSPIKIAIPTVAGYFFGLGFSAA